MPSRSNAVDDYLARLPDESRRALEQLRRMVHRLVRQAEEGISYGMPVFRLDGSPILGFRAAARHCAIYPFSGKTIATLAEQLSEYKISRGTIRFPAAQVPPLALVRLIIQTRIGELSVARKIQVEKSASRLRRREIS